MTIDLDAIEKLAKEATPGPWRSVPGVLSWVLVPLAGGVNGRVDLDMSNLPNAEFVAAANPSAVLDLIAEIRRMRKQALADLSATGQCIEEHIWPGHQKYESLMGIARDLAADDGAMLRDDIDQLCRRARELVGGGE